MEMGVADKIFRATLDDKNNINVFFTYNADLVKSIKDVVGARWDKNSKLWKFSALAEIANEIDNLILPKNYKKEYDDGFKSLLEKYSEIQNAQKIKFHNDLPQPDIRKFDSWNHQRQAYHYIMARDSALLYMGMGTGKTKVTVDVIMNRGHKRVLIVCPKSVLDVWKEEFEKHTSNHNSWMLFNGTKGPVKKRCADALKQLELAEQRGVVGIYVCNYEIVWREDFKTFMKDANIDLIVADESQKIKGHNAKASKALYEYGKSMKYKLALTGTPMPNSPVDIFGQMRFLNEGIFGRYFTKFKNTYCRMGGYGGYEIMEYINTDEMNEKIYSITYKADRSVLELPKEIHVRRYANLEGKTLRAYNEMKNYLVVQIENGELTASNALSQLLRLQQIASGYVSIENGFGEREMVQVGTEKIDTFIDVIDEIEKDEPVVVFCRFSQDITNVIEALKKQGRVVGELSGKRNDLADFKAGKFDSLVIQVQAGGVGVDLTRARYCIYYSIGFSLGDYEQSLARISRPGQKSDHVIYTHIIARNTVDEKIYKALEDKKDIVKSIIDDL